MPPARGKEEEDGGSGEDDTSFSFPSVATTAREGADSAGKGGGGGSDGGYSGWARRVMATASGEGRFGRRLRIGPWAKKVPRDEGGQTKGGSSSSAGLWPRWDASRPPVPTASRQHQRLARYRQEMLELVRDAPESAYELSLRDLVQLPRPADGRVGEKDTAGTEGQVGIPGEGQQGTAARVEDEENLRKRRAEKKVKPEKETWRSRKDGTGAFVWNMAFLPFVASLSGWKKKITETATTTAKMSPKAVVHDEGKCETGKKAVDYGWGLQLRSKTKDRWVIGKSGSASSDSSSGSQRSRKRTGCSIWL